ncbi:response regulator [Shewanella gelidii]|uniref:DNA-binding response regulator n=1 Tax=Shewanella gelidii TaxID=1642821 RepID=A0A917JR97_9GAMM|nr:response regulator [Shewanella gelidii]MCL1098474.1 response regulator [Shewanella gelidii]GGI82487.1 DNA-binding response regulator [Shewanella gelidii]
MSQILLVDDDKGLADLLGQLLEMEGFELSFAYDGEQGLAMARAYDFDLILLDVMLPKRNGFELLKELRLHKQTPVLMLTAKGDDIDRVVGLEIGADDYLAKPFNDRELIARIRAIIRRSAITAQALDANSPLSTSDTSANEAPSLLKQGDITLDISRQEAYCNEQILILTSTEFALLHQLIEHTGAVLEKEALNEQVLGKKLMPFDRSLDMHLSNLRKKLPPRDDGRARVKTIRGKGYIWIP